MSVDFNFDNLTKTFHCLLKTLLLEEYPCKKVYQNNTIIKFPNGKKFLMKDDDEYINRKAELLDLIKDKKSPWYTNYAWSNEANKIRELYINDPKAINVDNIEQYFNTLRLIDKNINEVDKGLLKFVNLNELVLNVNWLEECDSNNIPSKLKSLDLSGNQISDLKSLIQRPLIELEHLGLAYNHIHDLRNYLQPQYWPSLVSIDLSGNHLSDLKDLILNKLKKLEKLKNLVLYGNPICLIPSYRGFIVDTLLSINYLDDQTISKDERFRYFNMRLYSESIRNEAEVTITVSNLKNIYMPYEMKYPENQPEFPVIIYKYYVAFNYVEDKEFNAPEGNKIQSGSSYRSNRTRVENDMKNYREVLRDRFTTNKTYYNKLLQTQQCDYNENIQFNDKGVLKIKHNSLKSLRDYMMHGMDIKVIEIKLTYDQPSENTEGGSPTLSKKGVDKKKDNKKDKGGSADNKKDKKPADNKKKKDINAFLADLEIKSTEETILGSFHLPLDTILDCNHSKIEQIFKQELKIPQYVVDEFEGNLDNTGKGGKDKGKDNKKNSASKTKPKNEPPKGNDKGKKKGDSKGVTPANDDDHVLVPKTLELNMKFELLNFQNFEQFRTSLNTQQQQQQQQPQQSISRSSKITNE